MDGALYRPTTPAACGTATAADDSLGDRMIKFVKGREFQGAYPQITQIDLKNLRNLWMDYLIFANAADRMPADCLRFIHRIRAVLNVRSAAA
jgi:hypothetical protein